MAWEKWLDRSAQTSQLALQLELEEDTRSHVLGSALGKVVGVQLSALHIHVCRCIQYWALQMQLQKQLGDLQLTCEQMQQQGAARFELLDQMEFTCGILHDASNILCTQLEGQETSSPDGLPIENEMHKQLSELQATCDQLQQHGVARFEVLDQMEGTCVILHDTSNMLCSQLEGQKAIMNDLEESN